MYLFCEYNVSKEKKGGEKSNLVQCVQDDREGLCLSFNTY